MWYILVYIYIYIHLGNRLPGRSKILLGTSGRYTVVLEKSKATFSARVRCLRDYLVGWLRLRRVFLFQPILEDGPSVLVARCRDLTLRFSRGDITGGEGWVIEEGPKVVREKTRPSTIEELDRSKFLPLSRDDGSRSPLLVVRCNASRRPLGQGKSCRWPKQIYLWDRKKGKRKKGRGKGKARGEGTKSDSSGDTTRESSASRERRNF